MALNRESQMSNVNYEIECQLCPPGQRAKYIGEYSRNLFTRFDFSLTNRRSYECSKDEFLAAYAGITYHAL